VMAATAVAVGAAPAAADTAANVTPATNLTQSSNWAGYLVTASSTTKFHRIVGSWTAPSVTCTPGSHTYSAFWIGLGGSSENSQGLEQIGTEADCSTAGQPVYSAWYELLPAAPQTLAMTISPGDVIRARVHVKGDKVTLTLNDTTTGDRIVKVEHTTDIDLSSAEWIAEAPSACSGNSYCQPLPLSDFQAVNFTDATTTAGGHTGSISDPAWKATAIELSGSGDDFGHQRFFESPVSGATATPSTLDTTGDSFSVSYASASTTTGSGSGGDGGVPDYPGGGGYPGGGYPGGGYPGQPGYAG